MIDSKTAKLWAQDTRTPVQQRQQELFRSLGTLARTRANLDNIARAHSGSNTPAVKLTPLQQRVIDAAVYVLGDLSRELAKEMQNLPSKKNLKKIDEHNFKNGLIP